MFTDFQIQITTGLKHVHQNKSKMSKFDQRKEKNHKLSLWVNPVSYEYACLFYHVEEGAKAFLTLQTKIFYG